jgi:hypothetical protein
VDHVGVGEPINGDAIFNGAMDNAAGVASLLEIAKEAKNSPDKPKRSILFLIVTGEEKGLLGFFPALRREGKRAKRPCLEVRPASSSVPLLRRDHHPRPLRYPGQRFLNQRAGFLV